VSGTVANAKKSGNGRTIVYVVVAAIVIAVIYFAVTSFLPSEAPSSQPVVEAPASSDSEPKQGEPEPSATEVDKSIDGNSGQVLPDWY